MGSGPVSSFPLRTAAQVKLVLPHLWVVFFFPLSLSLKACGIRGKEGQRFGPVLCQGNVPAIFFQPGQGVLGMASFPGSLHTCSLPPRRSISSSCLRFSELPSLRGISTCLLPELPDHKELTAGQAR